MHVVSATLGLCLATQGLFAQTGWTVKPEWVRAHEEFLASDVMAGRGSATRDEQIAATYVASEFMGYGLKFAPGMTGYLQSAEVVSPVLDGHATLHVGSATLSEGAGVLLLSSSGVDVQAKLRKVDAAEIAKAGDLKGAAVLLTGKTTLAAARTARRAGAALVLLPRNAEIDHMVEATGGKTQIGIRLKTGLPGSRTLVAVDSQAATSLAAQEDGAVVELRVHELPQPPRSTYNAIGYLPGSDPKAGTILLTAHLDHLGIGPAVNGDTIYNGANDDAAGTTAVLELAHALAAGPQLKRSVLFVCYGSEEAGELGSEFFGEHTPVPLKDLVANVEFEMIGSQDPKMPKDTLLFTGWSRSNLGPTLAAHGAKLGDDPYPDEHFFERSDNYQLALQGVVAHTAAGYGTVPTYHQPNDDLEHLDLPFMTAAIQSLVEPLRWLASSDFKPEWSAGGQPKR
ncbi:Peptidase family M28 [Granulicella rosea]|uniref:Peptidase family M28 n=1 Tax=Granulicella rosea TaxID=474952 RepID=A0A239J5M9_9BACT|nr:M28 family peptidase [Granulicella rosea]SNT01115.1 Peptidase family M28 [Granulicella rosea]